MNTRLFARLALLALVFSGPIALVAQEDKPPKTPERLFADLDKNGDGKLTADEIAPERKQYFEHLLRVAGKEEDQELTKDEFLKALKPDDLKVAAPPGLGGLGGMNRPNPDDIFRRWDVNKDGKLVLDEIPAPQRDRYKNLFDRLGKSELTKDEFTQAFRRALGGGGGGELFRDPEAFFKRHDSNQDGKLTVAEAPEPMRSTIERWLTRVGKEKDEALTLDDAKKIIAENQARMPGQPGQGMGRFQPPFFRKLDANGDGKLSKEEWAKAVDLFDEFDANHDGQLEPAELFAPPGGPRGPGGAGPGGAPPAINPRRAEGADAAAPPRGRAGQLARGEGTENGTERPASAARGRLAAQAASARGPIRRLDADGDGKISRDEARGKLKENFDKIDADSDGFLDSAEIRKALQSLAAR